MTTLNAVLLVTLIVAGIAVALLSAASGHHAWRAATLDTKASEQFGLSERSFDFGRILLYYSSIGRLGTSPTETEQRLRDLQKQATAERGTAYRYTFLTALAASLLLLPAQAKNLAWASRQTRLIFLSFIFLVAGVVMPVLSSTTAVTIPVIGEIVLVSGAKSILGAVRDLISTAPLLASALLLFSVITPGFKIASLFYLVKNAQAKRLRIWVEKIGRWSMADVFVVSLILTFLALGQSPANTARVEPGLYFFAASALLALTAGTRISMIAENQQRQLSPD